MKKIKIKTWVFGIVLMMMLLIPLNSVFPFAYIFGGEQFGEDIITHPTGYTGIGGTLTVTVGIDPTSANATAMETSVENVVLVFNNLVSTTGNITFGVISNSQIDFESVLLHELGHSLGLAHCNAASESGLTGASQNYTRATNGVDNVFNINAGSDGIIGSEDDIRGDDVNLNFFKIVDNNPFTLPASNIFDGTTYSRDLSDLPSGVFSANADRTLSSSFGVANTEAAMQQGSFSGEIQRTLGADDVAGISFAMSGIDEIQGTTDDYNLVLNYIGMDANADIVIDFDNNETGFAVSQSSANSIGSTNHWRIIGNNIFFNTGFNWFFNNVSLNTNEQQITKENTKIYPNSNKGSFTIDVGNDFVTKVQIFSGTGKLVYSFNEKFQKRDFNLSLPTGVYHVRITVENGEIVNKKMIVS